MPKGGVTIGLDISSDSIKVAAVNITRAAPVLVNLGMVLLPEGVIKEGEVEDPAALSGLLRDLMKQTGIRKKRVTLGIANQKVIVRPMDLPYMPDEELESAVRYQVQEFIPIPIDEAVVDFEVVDEYMTGEEERMQTILLAAAHRDMIQAFLDALSGAGLVPDAIEVKAFAMARSLIKRELTFLEEAEAPEQAQTACLINIGAGITNICVIKEGTPRFVRMLIRGGEYFTEVLTDALNISPVEAEDIKRGRSTDEQANAFLEREVRGFVGEIGRSLEYYVSQTQERDLGRIILSGSGSKIVNLPVELNKSLDLPVEIGHPLQNVQLGRLPYTPEELAELEASLAVCVGLALRELEE
ncbi:MAG: type IV pilus assembly protein PilM [Actinomycetota bacterium]|nr:type IV pilus assembly protein PilM [Actinomycetota bacterium]